MSGANNGTVSLWSDGTWDYSDLRGFKMIDAKQRYSGYEVLKIDHSYCSPPVSLTLAQRALLRIKLQSGRVRDAWLVLIGRAEIGVDYLGEDWPDEDYHPDKDYN